MSRLKHIFCVLAALCSIAAAADSLSLPTTSLNGTEYYYHTVKKGETVYGIAKQLGITVDDVIRNNNIENNHITVGQILYFPVDRYSDFTKTDSPIYSPVVANDNSQKVEDGMLIYTMGKNESIFSVAMKHKTTVDAIRDANPGVKQFKKGAKIRILLKSKEEYEVPAEEPEVEEVKEPVYPHYFVKDTVNVAIVLPFMLRDAEPDAQALNATEFYKGFLIAVDSVRHETRKHINVCVFDTQSSDSATTAVFAEPLMRTMHAIIAPGDNSLISKANNFGQANGIPVFNLFNIRDTKYRTDSLAFQCNVPSANMNDHVTNWFIDKFSDYCVVFLEKDIDDSKDFYSGFRMKVTQSNMENCTLEGSGVNTSAINKIMLPGKKYVFVPNLATKRFLSQVAKSLKSLKTERPDVELCLFGYPQYMTYTTDTDIADDISAVDTYFYTSYFYNPQNYFTQKFETVYKGWYNENMRYSTPRMGLLGFDCGMFLLRALLNNDIYNGTLRKHNGLQTDFDFERIGHDSGFFNKSVNIIRYTPYGSIEKH